METVIFELPAVAFDAIVNVAVIWVGLKTLIPVTVIAELELLTVVPETKFVPVSVTGKLLPADPLEGLTELRVGAPGVLVTVNVTPLLVPADVVAVSVYGPGVADAAMFKVAVI